MHRPVIAIDIDDVLASHVPSFIAFGNERWGTHLTIDDYDEDWARMWRLSRHDGTHRQEIDRRVNEFFSEAISTMPHDETAAEVLHVLKANFDLLIVTSRRLSTKGDTLAWVQKNFPGVFEEDKILFAGIWGDIADSTAPLKTKADVLRVVQADYLIDDQVKHCNAAAAECNMKALLFGDYPWQNGVDTHDNVVKVKTWHDVLEYFNAERQRISD